MSKRAIFRKIFRNPSIGLATKRCVDMDDTQVLTLWTELTHTYEDGRPDMHNTAGPLYFSLEELENIVKEARRKAGNNA